VGINTCKNFQILNFKKGRIGRLMLTTLDLWKIQGKNAYYLRPLENSRYRVRCFFSLKV
jgi:hypothetical protein